MKGTLRGANEMVAKLKKLATEYPERVKAAIYQEAQIEMTEAKRRCPVSPTPAPPGVVPGTMRASGTVHEPTQEGRNMSVVMSFGGAAEDYVVPQHENPDYFHTTGQYKWLESTLNESRPYMAGRIAKRIDFNQMKVE
jgi:hypothetical protein